MRFFKGVFFPDGRPVPVGFERKDGEPSFVKFARSGAEKVFLSAKKYNDDELHGRTELQTILSQHLATSKEKRQPIIETIEDRNNNLEDAYNEAKTAEPNLQAMHEYAKHLEAHKRTDEHAKWIEHLRTIEKKPGNKPKASV